MIMSLAIQVDYEEHWERYSAYRATHSIQETIEFIAPFYAAMIKKWGEEEWDEAGIEFDKLHHRRN